MSKVIQNKGGIGVGAPYDLPGYEYDPVNDTFKDLESGKVFSKEYVASTSGTGTGTGTSTIKLESNKAASIDVSQYTEPVVITPTEGKDGMEQTTVTLTNIPSGGSNSTILYAWSTNGDTVYFNVSVAPASSENLKKFEPNSAHTRIDVGAWGDTGGGTYEKVSDTEFTSDNAGYVETFTRDAENDLVI